MSTISASTLITTALQYTADTTGALVFQTGATPTTALTLAADQSATFTGTVNFATAGFTNLSYTGTFTGGTGVVNIGSGQIYKDSSGNVGIGTSSPYSVANYTGLTLNGTNGSTFSLFTNGTRSFTAYSTSGAVVLGSVTSVSLVFNTADTERMRIDSSGNVGIGTNSPTKKLTVAGTDSGAISLIYGTSFGLTFQSDAANGFRIEAADVTGSASYQPLILSAYSQIFRTSGSEKMRLDNSGNLLLGTSTTPSGITNSLTFLDGTYQKSANITVGSILEYNATTTLPQSAFGRLVTSNTASATTLTMPTIAGNSGKVITISNIGSGIVTINAGENTSAFFVNGYTYTGSPASFILAQGMSVQMATDGGNWKAVQTASWGIGGQNQSWQNVTASRALGTTYTNTTGRSIQVMVSLSQNTAGYGHQFYVGGINFNAGQNNSTGGITTSSWTIVPNGVTYSVSAQSGESIGTWNELR